MFAYAQISQYDRIELIQTNALFYYNLSRALLRSLLISNIRLSCVSVCFNKVRGRN